VRELRKATLVFRDMARRRFFVDAIRDGSAELRGDDALHLTRVLRAQVGQCYEITDSRTAWLAQIAESRSDRVVFRVLEEVPSPEVPVRLTLVAALIKFDRFEWMIEKATELGVKRIVPFLAARSEKGLLEASHKRSDRWSRIARESSQQSRRLRAPDIAAGVPLEAALAEAGDYRYFLDECGAEGNAPPLVRMLPQCRAPSARVALLIGPEGGWTEQERLRTNAAGWQAVSLGPQTLRAETAAMAAAAIVVSAWWGWA
jgi:16S rRNA (uracil1498-N3)-methyltransferase